MSNSPEAETRTADCGQAANRHLNDCPNGDGARFVGKLSVHLQRWLETECSATALNWLPSDGILNGYTFHESCPKTLQTLAESSRGMLAPSVEASGCGTCSG